MGPTSVGPLEWNLAQRQYKEGKCFSINLDFKSESHWWMNSLSIVDMRESKSICSTCLKHNMLPEWLFLYYLKRNDHIVVSMVKPTWVSSYCMDLYLVIVHVIWFIRLIMCRKHNYISQMINPEIHIAPIEVKLELVSISVHVKSAGAITERWMPHKMNLVFSCHQHHIDDSMGSFF